MKKIIGFLTALAISATAVIAQQINLPPNTVYGRLGISSGPGQAIPFQVLKDQLSLIANIATTQTSAPTINSFNCGQLVPLGGATFYSFTVAAATNFPAGCFIRFYNADPMPNAGTTGAKVIAVNGIDGCTTGQPSTYLWPQQLMEITNNKAGTGWMITRCPGLWEVPTGTVIINVDPSNGSDTWGVADGLALTTRAFRSMQGALTFAAELIQENFFAQTSLVFKCVASCTDSVQVHWPTHGGAPLGAQGGAGTIIDCNGGSMTGGVQIFFNSTLGIQNCTFTTNPITVTENSVLVFGTGGPANTLNGVEVQLQEGARIRCLTCTVNITGSFARVFTLSVGSGVQQININQTGNVTYSDVAFRVQSGSFASVNAWTTNGFTATGKKFDLIECASMEGTGLIAGTVAGTSSCTQAN